MVESVVKFRVDPKIKKEADRLFHKMGLTMSGAIRLFLYRVTTEKRLPFPVEIPNKQTIKAMEAARRGEVEPVTLEQMRKEWEDAECEK